MKPAVALGLVGLVAIAGCGGRTESSTFGGDASAGDTSTGDGGCEPLPGCTSRTECADDCNSCMCDPGSDEWTCTLVGCDGGSVPRDGGVPPRDGGRDAASEAGSDAALDAPGKDACVPATCATLGYDCGYAADGCGGLLLCGGPCIAPQFCGGGGFDKCGGCSGTNCQCFACQPLTCPGQKIACGPASDGCGNVLNCGACPGDSGACVPSTCAQQGIACGVSGDGCGGELMCGVCTPPEACGGGGVPGHCGPNNGGKCLGATCGDQNINCGPAGDGYGVLLQCGTCTPPHTCGGGGFGRCG